MFFQAISFQGAFVMLLATCRASSRAPDSASTLAISQQSENLECGLVATAEELLQELTVAESPRGSHAKQRLHVATGSLQGESSVVRHFMAQVYDPRVLPGRG